jgi:hypothetical protein
MAQYTCAVCGGTDTTGWTYFYTYIAMGLPPVCARCDPNQRCHWHHTCNRTPDTENDSTETPLP